MSQSKTETTRSGSPGANWQLSTLKSLCTSAGWPDSGRCRARSSADPVDRAAAPRSRPPPSGAASRGAAGPGSRRGGRDSRGRSPPGRPGAGRPARRPRRSRSAARARARPRAPPARGPRPRPGAVLRDQEVGADDRRVGAVVQPRAEPAGTPRAAARARCTRGACRGHRPRSCRTAVAGRPGRRRRTGPGRSGWPSRWGTAAPRSRPSRCGSRCRRCRSSAGQSSSSPGRTSATSGRSARSLIRGPAAPRRARDRRAPGRRRPRHPGPGAGSSGPGAPR